MKTKTIIILTSLALNLALLAAWRHETGINDRLASTTPQGFFYIDHLPPGVIYSN